MFLILLALIPFSWTFEQLLRPPTKSELRRVDRDWSRKVLNVGNIREVGAATVPVGSDCFDAHIYSYTLNGSPRCGAILLPPDAGRVTGLVDIGDISWDYPDRNLTNGPYVAKILGDRARDFALIVPCSRGMALRIGDVRVQSGGDRRDAWEGDAEDAMSFLTVALKSAPQIDPKRLGVYGYSRGGGVALIMGERDPRIKAVLSFAGPTDFFSAMGRPGVNWPARLQEVWGDPDLRKDTREYQYLDWFVRDREKLPLSELRRRLVGASPLYFVEKLPPFQMHQGADDVAVPVVNATLVRDRIKNKDAVFIYPGAGHRLDDTPALANARAFLVEHLGARASRPQ